MPKVRYSRIYFDLDILTFGRHVRNSDHMCLAQASRHANLTYDTIFFSGFPEGFISFLEENKFQVQCLAIDGRFPRSRKDVIDLTNALRRCNALRYIVMVVDQGRQARNECQLKRFSVSSFVELSQLKLTGTDGEQLEIKDLLNTCIPPGLYGR
jgi:hypothetical protein